jgi:hypothetical protein
MATGVEYKEYGQSSPISSNDLVIDITNIKDFLKPWTDAKQLAQRINEWAEDQIDTQWERDMFKSQMAQIKTPDQFDAQMDTQLQLEDKSILLSILKDYVSETFDVKKSISDLAQAIHFQLTPAWNNKFMNGTQAETYYNTSGQQKPTNVSGWSNTPTYASWSAQEIWNSIPYAGTNTPKESPQSSLNKTERSQEMPDDLTKYDQQNLYKRNTENISDSSKWSERKVLRNWIRGSRDGFLDIIETKWDAKFTRPDAAEKNRLRQYFKRPLRDLVIKNKDINLENIRNEMQSIVNTKGNVLQWLWSESSNADYRKNNIPSEWSVAEKDKKEVAESLGKLSALYVSWRRDRTFAWSYTDRLMGMLNNFNNGDKLYNFADGEDITVKSVDNEFKNVTDANNDNVGETQLTGWHELLDKQSKDNRALRELSSLVGGWKTPDFFDDKNINSFSMQSVLNVALTGKFPREDTTLRTILKQNPDLLSVIEKAKWSTSETYSPNFDVMLAEAKAYGASAVDVYNIKALAEFGDVDEARRWKVSDGLRFANFLADYDHNGNAWAPADYGVNSWGQILRNFTSASWEIANTMPHGTDGKPDVAKAEEIVSKSILAYAMKTADLKGDYYVTQVLQKYFSGWKSVLELPKEHPGLLKYVQLLLKNNQAKLHSIMFASIAPEGNVGSLESYRTEEYMTLAQDMSGKSLDEILKNVPVADKAQAIPSIKQQAKTLFDSQYTSALSSLSSEEQAYFKGYVSLPLLENHIANLVAQDLTINQQWAWLALGVWLVKHVQLNLWVAMWPDGKPLPGIGLWFSNEAKTLWANANWTLFWPNIGAYATLAKWNNRDELANTLSVRAKNTNSVGLHAGYSNLSTWAGLSYHQNRDHLWGIDHTANAIRSEANQFVDQLLNNATLAGHVAAIDRITRERWWSLADSELNSHTIGLRNIIRSTLTKKYPDQSSEEYEVAVENIVGGIMQAQYTWDRRERDNIVNYFVEQRRGAAISDLKWKTKVTDWGIGLHAFVNPKNLIAWGPLWAISAVLPFSIQISKYDRGFGSRDTKYSQQLAKMAQEAGIGNREMSMTLDQRVDHLNGAIIRSRWMIDLQKQKAFPKITTDGKFIYIPKLYYIDNVLNVKISPDMAGKIAHEWDNLVVPVSTDLRFFSKFESQHAVNVLNIGSTDTSGSDIHLLRFKEDKLSTQIDGKPLFVDKDTIDVTSTVVWVEGINEDNLKQKLIAWWLNIATIRIENNILVYTTTNNSIEQKVSINGGKIWDITLSATNEGLTISKTTTSWTQKKELKDIVSYDIWENTNRLIEGLSKINPTTLENFEKTHPTQLRSFLSALIDNDDNEALSVLKWLDIPILQDAIKNANDTLSKWEIAAYMAQAFALEPEYKNYKSAIDLMKERDKQSKTPAFERIDWPNSTISSFLTRDMLKSAYENTLAKVWQPSLWDRAEDVLGYTAFYRGRNPWEHRGYAMTVPWYTNILWGKSNYKEFDAAKWEKAKQWLFDKIEHDTFARESIVNGLKKNVLDEYKQYVEPLSKLEKLPDLIKLLNGGIVSLGGKCDLQVSATPIFYLLAECANESIWLKINVVTCTGDDGKIISEKIAGKSIEQYNLWRYGSNVVNTTWFAVWWKRVVLNATWAVGTTFDWGSKSWWPKEWDGVVTNPAWDWGDTWSNGAWSWLGWNGWDTWSNSTWGWS